MPGGGGVLGKPSLRRPAAMGAGSQGAARSPDLCGEGCECKEGKDEEKPPAHPHG